MFLFLFSVFFFYIIKIEVFLSIHLLISIFHFFVCMQKKIDAFLKSQLEFPFLFEMKIKFRSISSWFFLVCISSVYCSFVFMRCSKLFFTVIMYMDMKKDYCCIVISKAMNQKNCSELWMIKQIVFIRLMKNNAICIAIDDNRRRWSGIHSTKILLWSILRTVRAIARNTQYKFMGSYARIWFALFSSILFSTRSVHSKFYLE